MLVNILRKPAPTGLTATAKLKFNRLKWNHVHDKQEHKYYLIYAYTNLTDLNADTNSTIIERVYENRFKDDRDTLAKGDFCGYRVSSIDIYHNESYKTGPVNVTFKHVGDTDVDHTPPGVPTGLTVGAGSIERDSDGTIVSNSLASWTAPVGGVPVKYYLLKVTQNSNSETVLYKTDTLSFPFRVKAGLQYDVQVKAFGFTNDASAYTTAVSYTRAKKTGDMPAVGTVNYVASKKRIKLDWADVNDDTYPDYRNTYIYRNTVNTAPTLGTTTPYKRTKAGYFIDDGVTTGQNYYYWIVHKDNSGNFGALSGALGPIQSGGNEVGSFSDLSGYVLSNQMATTDPNAYAENSDLSLGPNVGWSDPTRVVSDPANSYGPEYVIKFSYTGAAASYVDRNNLIFPVRVGEQYTFGGMSKTDASWAGANYGWRLSGLNASKVEVATSPLAGGIGATTSWFEQQLNYTVPAGVAFLRLEWASYNQTAGIGFGSHGYVRPTVINTMTDQRLPTTPTGLSIAAGALEMTDDGAVNAEADVTWNAVTTGVPFTHYRVKRTQVSNGKIRYFDVPAGVLIASLQCKTGVSYNYQVTTVTFNNKEGAYSSAVAYTRPKKTANLPAPGALSFVSSKKRIKIDWADVNDDTYPDYRMTYLYRNTVNTAPTLGTTTPYKKMMAGYYLDEGVTTGQNYYYWVAHKDKSGNFTVVSTNPGPVTSGGNEVSGFTDLTGSIAGAQIPSSTVDTLMIVDSAVTPRKANLGNTSSLMKDTQLIDSTLWSASGGTGPSISVQPNNAAALGPSKNFFRVQSALAIGQSLTFASLPLNPCTPGSLITFSAYIKRYLPASLFAVTLSVDWYTLDASGNAVFLSGSTGSTLQNLVSGTTVYNVKLNEVVPDTAAFFAIKVVTAAAASATTYGFDIGGILAVKAVGSIMEATQAGSSVTVPGSSSGTIITHVCNHTVACTQVKFSFRFKQNSGANRNLSFEIYKNAVLIHTTTSYDIVDQHIFNYDYLDNNITGVSDTYTVKMYTGASSATVIHQYSATEAVLA